jgi:hypothetical protein
MVVIREELLCESTQPVRLLYDPPKHKSQVLMSFLVTSTGEPLQILFVSGHCVSLKAISNHSFDVFYWLPTPENPIWRTRLGNCSARRFHVRGKRDKPHQSYAGDSATPSRHTKLMNDDLLFYEVSGFTGQPTGHHDRVGVHRDSKDHGAERRQQTQNKNLQRIVP